MFLARLGARMAMVAGMVGAPGCVSYHYSSRSVGTEGFLMTATDDNGKQTVNVEGTCASDTDAWEKTRRLLQDQCTNGDSFKGAPLVPCVNGLFRTEVKGCRLRESPRPRLETQLDIPLYK